MTIVLTNMQQFPGEVLSCIVDSNHQQLKSGFLRVIVRIIILQYPATTR